MGTPKYVKHNGINYRIQTTGRYYSSGRHGDPERLLHRRVWYDKFGEIPAGMHVHHKNGDWTDNRLENLELVDGGEHSRAHCLERLADPQRAAQWREITKLGVAAAPEWHSSPEGLAWHTQHAKLTWDNREAGEVGACEHCGKVVVGFIKSKRFCSLKCTRNASYRTHKTSVGICPECGASFVFNKYRTQECCSRGCAIRRRSRMKASPVSDTAGP